MLTHVHVAAQRRRWQQRYPTRLRLMMVLWVLLLLLLLLVVNVG